MAKSLNSSRARVSHAACCTAAHGVCAAPVADSIRLLLREALSEYGYDVDTAADGAEGLALFELINHDLVPTDLMMPAITGWDLARQLRRVDPTLPIIILTAYGQGLEDDARCQGILLMHKPVRLNAIAEAIAEALDEAGNR